MHFEVRFYLIQYSLFILVQFSYSTMYFKPRFYFTTVIDVILIFVGVKSQ